MPTYTVTDPTTGRSLKLTGDSPPTEAELNEVFASVGRPAAPPQEAPVAPTAPETPSNPVTPPTTPPAPALAPPDAVGTIEKPKVRLRDLPSYAINNAGKFVSSLYDLIHEPEKVGKGLLYAAMGAANYMGDLTGFNKMPQNVEAEKATPLTSEQKQNVRMADTAFDPFRKSIDESIRNPAGVPERAADWAIQNPIDALLMFSGGAGVLGKGLRAVDAGRKASIVSKAGKILESGDEAGALAKLGELEVPSGLSKAASVAETASKYTNPMTPVGYAAGKVSNVLKPIVSKGSMANVPAETAEMMKIWQEHGYTPSAAEMMPGGVWRLMEGVMSYEPASNDVFFKFVKEKLDRNLARRAELMQKATGRDPGTMRQIEMLGNDVKDAAREILEKYSTKSKGEITDLVDNLLGQYGTSASGRMASGAQFKDILKGKDKAMADEVRSLYQDVQADLPKQGYETIDISEPITEELKAVKKQIGQATEKPSDLMKYVNRYLPKKKTVDPKVVEQYEAMQKMLANANPNFLASNPEVAAQLQELEAAMNGVVKPKVTWESMKQDMTNLQRKISKVYREEGRATTSVYYEEKIKGLIDQMMSDYAEGIGGDLWQKYQNAKATAKKHFDLFDKDILDIGNKSPDQVIDAAIKNNRPGMILDIQAAVGEEGMAPLRQGLTRKLIENASVKSGEVDLTRLGRDIRKMGESWDAIMTSDQRAAFDHLLNAGQTELDKLKNIPHQDFIKMVLNKDAPKIVETLIRPNYVENIKVAKKLFSPDLMKEVTEQALADILKLSPGGHFLPVTSAKNWTKYRTVMEQLVPKDVMPLLDDFIKGGMRSDAVEKMALNTSQTGQTLIGHSYSKRLKESIFNLATGEFKKGGGQMAHLAGELAMNRYIAKMYLSPAAREYFLRSLKSSPTSTEALSNFGRAVQIVNMEAQKGKGALEEAERSKARQQESTTITADEIDRVLGGK